MSLVFFLIILVASECKAFRGPCGGGDGGSSDDDYYQSRHRGIRRYYGQIDIPPEDVYGDSISEIGLDDDHGLIDDDDDDGVTEPDELPVLMVPKSSRISRAKYMKMIGRYLKNSGYKVVGKKSSNYGNLILLSPRTVNQFASRDEAIVKANGNEVDYPDLVSDGDEYKSLHLGDSNNIHQLSSRRRVYGSSAYEHANSEPIFRRRPWYRVPPRQKNKNANINSNINRNIHRDRDDLGDMDSVFKGRRTLTGSNFLEHNQLDRDIKEDEIEMEELNTSPAVENAKAPRAKVESEKEKKHFNVNTNINGVNESSPMVIVTARRNSHNIDTDSAAARRHNDHKNTNVNTNVNTNMNTESGDPLDIPTARRKLVNGDGGYAARDMAASRFDKQVSRIGSMNRRLNTASANKNVNINSNINVENHADKILKKNLLNTEFGLTARRNLEMLSSDDMPGNAITGYARKTNKNMDKKTNNNVEEGDVSSTTVIAARGLGLNAEGSYGARNIGVNSDVESIGNIASIVNELNPTEIIPNTNENENANVNVNLNAEGAGRGISPILASVRKRVSSLHGGHKNFRRTMGFARPGISRRSQLHPKNENHNVNINVNRFESDEV